MNFHKKIITAATILFFAAMLVLSLTAEDLHNSSLPRVTLVKLPTYRFPYEYTGENGETLTGSAEKTAVTAEMLGNGIYCVYTAEKNGTPRQFARKYEIETGDEADGYYEVVSGVSGTGMIIGSSDRELYDNAEVIVLPQM